MAEARAHLPRRVYGWLCGQELSANLLHFQFLPAYYARRDIRRDGPALSGTLLDVGCGNQPYRPHMPGVAHYVGVDYPPAQVGLHPTVRPALYGDARALPFADGSFDCLLCCQVLEHVDRPARALGEMARVLKPGGVGLISVPFFYNLHMQPHDYFRFSPYGITNLLKAHGLKVRRLRGQGGIGTLLVQMFHNWAFTGVLHQARRRRLLALVWTLALPLLLVMAAVNNLLALALDRLNGDDLRFTPNLWIMVEKEAGDRAAPQKRG